MPVTDAPTSPRGTISTSHLLTGFGMGSIDDALERVPDLAWPLSVETYARMRYDPTIQSVLAAYVKPVVRARWSIDPRGASDAMVKICADSLGLPVLGQPDEPGPWRRRGVRWRKHVKLAAATMLTWGHAPFEPTYDVTTGTAVLAALGERLPASIDMIDTDSQGQLLKIRQRTWNATLGQDIPADRLLWYVRDREGAAWQGVSLLRHAFGPWLIKQDMLRVNGTGLRRFAAGTPTLEQLPGTTPTREQTERAQAAVRAIRVGETGGLTAPGFRLRIVGVEGTLPDAMPTIHYLDQQIARGALTSLLDLANTGTGNRALGDVFADVMTMALESFAEELAETATELCVALTDFNEGDTANSPAVHVDMSASRAAIADSLSQLVQAGGLTMDDTLQAWVRDALSLPKPDAANSSAAGDVRRRDVAETIQKTYLGVGTIITPDEARTIVNTAGADLPVPGPFPAGPKTPAPAAPVAGAGASVTADAWPYRRALTAAEQAAGFDPAAIDDAQARTVDALLAAWTGITDAWIADLTGQIKDAVTAGNIAALGAMVVDTADAADTLAVAMAEAADAGVTLATAEAGSQGVKIPAGTGPDQDTLTAMAAVTAAVMGQAFAAAAAREAVRLVGSAGTTAADVAGQVESFLTDLSGTYPQDVLGGAVADAINAGRLAVFDAAPDTVSVTYVASEIRDAATCAACADVDGTHYDTIEAATADYVTGGYALCLGRERCRGVLVAVWGEGVSSVADVAAGGKPSKGTSKDRRLGTNKPKPGGKKC